MGLNKDKVGVKLVKNINNEKWNKFVGYCRIDGKKVGHAINDLLNDFLDKREKRIKVRKCK